MKNFLLTLILGFSLIATSCSKSGGGDDPTEDFIKLSYDALVYSKEKSTQKVDVACSTAKWSASVPSADKWCQISTTSGVSGASVGITVSENTTGETRSTAIVFKATGTTATATLLVTQTGEEGEGLKADPDPWDGVKRGNISYQLLVYSFADSNGDGEGDFKGLADKMAYISELGAQAIWLSPIHPADSHHGYDVRDYTKVNPEYGTLEDFKNLVKEAHKYNVKVYIDYVLNHTGKGHQWFIDACSSETSAHRNYYLFSKDPENDVKNGILPMFSDKGYNKAEWFTAPNQPATSKRIKLTLNWNAKTILAEESSTVDPANPDTSTTNAKYIYWGDGNIAKMYDQGEGIYTLNFDLVTSWGLLIRTDKDSWAAGTKLGSASTTARLKIGTPFPITSSGDPSDIIPDWLGGGWMVHSNFCTEWMPDINYGPIEAFKESGPYKEVVEAAKGWIDCGIDGFRLDAVKHIYHNQTSDENPRFLNGFYNDLNDYFSTTHTAPLYMVGEVFEEANVVAPYYRGLPAYFEFSFWNRLQWAETNSTGCYFVNDILSYNDLYNAVSPTWIAATKLTNHDESRARTLLDGGSNNNDLSLKRAKSAAAVLLTSRGEPYVYYGEELGYFGDKTVEGYDGNVRNPMKWGDKYTTTYIKTIDPKMSLVPTVADQGKDKNSILSLYKELGTLRNTYSALATGEMKKCESLTSATAYKQLCAFYRTDSNGSFLVLHNFGNSVISAPVEDTIDKPVFVLGKATMEGNTVNLHEYSSVVFKLK